MGLYGGRTTGGKRVGGKGALLEVAEGTSVGLVSKLTSVGKGEVKATVTTPVLTVGMWMIELTTLPPGFSMVATTTMTIKRVARAVTPSTAVLLGQWDDEWAVGSPGV